MIYTRREFSTGGLCDGVPMALSEWEQIRGDNDFTVTIPNDGGMFASGESLGSGVILLITSQQRDNDNELYLYTD